MLVLCLKIEIEVLRNYFVISGYHDVQLVFACLSFMIILKLEMFIRFSNRYVLLYFEREFMFFIVFEGFYIKVLIKKLIQISCC